MPDTTHSTTVAPTPAPAKLTTIQLLRGLGGGRYAFATLVSSLGGGLIRPFLLLYAVTISGISAERAGLALSVGFLVGLAAGPLGGPAPRPMGRSRRPPSPHGHHPGPARVRAARPSAHPRPGRLRLLLR